MHFEQIKSNLPFWRLGLQFFVQISGWIVFPILISLVAGKWLDAKLHKEPFFLLSLTFAAFIITNVGLILNTIKFLKRFDQNKSQGDSFRK